jgi:arylsulfatase A-like enzyme
MTKRSSHALAQGDGAAETSELVMPALHELLLRPGQRLANFFATTPLCCPSRVSILRGQ